VCSVQKKNSHNNEKSVCIPIAFTGLDSATNKTVGGQGEIMPSETAMKSDSERTFIDTPGKAGTRPPLFQREIHNSTIWSIHNSTMKLHKAGKKLKKKPLQNN
jgi:hypothetical protein